MFFVKKQQKQLYKNPSNPTGWGGKLMLRPPTFFLKKRTTKSQRDGVVGETCWFPYGFDMMKKIAIFPDGYRKNKDATVSERALKHVNHLASIHKENPEIVCALLFLIQRNDVDSFKPSSLDMIYHKALYEARDAGVKIIPVCVEWIDNKCHFLKLVKLL